MQRIWLITLSFFFITTIAAQTGRVGINTTSPVAGLHVKDSSVVFTGPNNLNSSINVPVSGTGVRMMWIPSRAAFRSGQAVGSSWDRDSIGEYSFAAGYDTKAIGDLSFAFGESSRAAGYCSYATGWANNATGDYSLSGGQGSNSSGKWSLSMGFNCDALGATSVAFGDNTRAKSYASLVIGRYNDTTSQFSSSWTSVDPLFIAGNGTSPNARSNAFTILKNGRVGIGIHNPGFLLNFPTAFGDKISLHGTSGNHYGFGVQSSLLQIYTDVTGSDIAFGFGSSSSFTETMRIKGTGRVGIGTNNPQFKLDVADRMRLRTGAGGESAGIWFNKLDNTLPIAFIGMLNNEYIGVYGEGGAAWNLMMSTITGNVGIGLQNPTEKLHVTGNGKFTGSVFASCGTLACSDIRYKTKITSLSNSLQNILNLKGIYYYWDIEKFPEQQFNDARQIGFSAQELEEIYPEMVHTDGEGFKSVDYSRMTPVLLEAIKEQQEMIEFLMVEVEKLKVKAEAEAKE